MRTGEAPIPVSFPGTIPLAYFSLARTLGLGASRLPHARASTAETPPTASTCSQELASKATATTYNFRAAVAAAAWSVMRRGARELGARERTARSCACSTSQTETQRVERENAIGRAFQARERKRAEWGGWGERFGYVRRFSRFRSLLALPFVSLYASSLHSLSQSFVRVCDPLGVYVRALVCRAAQRMCDKDR